MTWWVLGTSRNAVLLDSQHLVGGHVMYSLQQATLQLCSVGTAPIEISLKNFHGRGWTKLEISDWDSRSGSADNRLSKGLGNPQTREFTLHITSTREDDWKWIILVQLQWYTIYWFLTIVAPDSDPASSAAPPKRVTSMPSSLWESPDEWCIVVLPPSASSLLEKNRKRQTTIISRKFQLLRTLSHYWF